MGEAFDQALALLLAHEGGYVEDPRDPGGATNYGISQRSYPDLDIAALTRDEAAALYRRDWWDRWRYGLLPATVAARVLLLAVNAGPVVAHRTLQRALTACGQAVTVDGFCGPKTRAAAHHVPERALLRAFRCEAARWYVRLAARRPDLAVYLKGWLNRAQA